MHHYLARGYQKYKEFGRAAESFKLGAQCTNDDEEKLAGLGDAAIAFTRAGQKGKAQATIVEMKDLAIRVEEGEALLISAMREIAEIEEEKDEFLGFTERLLDLQPDDINLRFGLAYKYSEAGHDNLSLLHYLTIPYREREAGTWNNIGVEYGRFNLNGKAVEAYRMAEELGETLAMSNLAQKLLNAGFLKEAEEICNKAVKKENYHKNIGNAIARIKDISEEEEKRQKEILGKAKPYREFYGDYGLAMVKCAPDELSGEWESPRCRLHVQIQQHRFVAEGRYEVQLLGIGALLAGTGSSSKVETARYRVRYEGVIRGRAIKCWLLVKEESRPAAGRGLLGEVENRKEALMIISDDLMSIRVYEKSGAEGQFYAIKRSE